MEEINLIKSFFKKYKREDLEFEDIILLKDEITKYYECINKNEFFKEYYNNYLLVKGYTYRLENIKHRLYHTFKEAVYAIDLSVLTRDEEGVKVNSYIYILVLNEMIAECLNEDYNINEKEKAISFYALEQKRKSEEDAKYHKYQY